MSKTDAAMVRSQLEKMLGSDLFARSERLSKFLRFIVEKSLKGLEDELKEQVLACELYDRGFDFDTAADPIVRVDARRLRDKLREYYSTTADPVIISLPKGSYKPVFERNPALVTPEAVELPAERQRATQAASRRGWLPVVAVPLAFIAAVTAWLVPAPPRSSELPVLPLSSLPGNEGPPTLSPDGNFVAFSWSDPASPGLPDIWIKAVDSEDRRRLTETPFDGEINPAWSPDGRAIAFIRGGKGSPPGVYVVSVLGVNERKVSNSGTHVGWARDSKSILIRDRESDKHPYGIFQIFLSTLERRRVTQAPAGAGDWTFEMSPDGSTLAWIRYDRPGISDIYVKSRDGGEPRRLTKSPLANRQRDMDS